MKTATFNQQIVTLSLPSERHFSLNGSPHLPGSGSVPDTALFNHLDTITITAALTADWQTNLVYRTGWTLFSAKFYWETHEAWERVWIAQAPNSQEKRLLECLIQCANFRLKRLLDKPAASEKIRQLASQLCAELCNAGIFEKNTTVMGVSKNLLQDLTA